jgi:hypothetical protein
LGPERWEKWVEGGRDEAVMDERRPGQEAAKNSEEEAIQRRGGGWKGDGRRGEGKVREVKDVQCLRMRRGEGKYRKNSNDGGEDVEKGSGILFIPYSFVNNLPICQHQLHGTKENKYKIIVAFY